MTDSNLFPAHLYQKDKLLEDPCINKLELAKQSLKIGRDTTFTTPVETFGSKILQNLGWKEGFGIGKDCDQPSAPIEYIPRQFRLGLGAKALTAEQATNKRQLTVTENYEASSIGKNIKRVGEELQVKKEMMVGSQVLIIGGSHEGLSGEIIAMKKQSGLAQESTNDLYVTVLLDKSEAVVQIKRRRLQLKRTRSRSPQQQVHERSQKRLKWVMEGIIVKCVSKSYKSGVLYNKELRVSAVLSEYDFEVTGDEVYSDLTERDLETVLPTLKQLEQSVRVDAMVLRGRHKGLLGKVLSIDKKRDIVQVQVQYSEVIKVSQDDVSVVQ